MGRALFSLTTALLLAVAGSLPAAAADVAEEILDKGITAYRAGKLEPAVGAFSAALRGRLSAEQTARAHYYRGLAHRKQGRPGYAVSDLTHALDSNLLSETERADAVENRITAYQEAGIAATDVVVTTAGDARPPERAPEWPTATPIRTVVTPAAAISSPVTTGTVAVLQAPAQWQNAPAWGGSTQVAVAVAAPSIQIMPPQPTTSVAPKIARTETPTTWSTGEVTIAPLPVVAAPIEKSPPKVAAARTARPADPPLSPFVTQVAAVVPEAPPAPPPATVRLAALPPAPLPPAAPLAAPENRLMVGETQSRSEAFALAIRLTSQYGPSLGTRKPTIAAGTMADVAVYRVMLGPFADARQAEELCTSLRSSGYGCITQ